MDVGQQEGSVVSIHDDSALPSDFDGPLIHRVVRSDSRPIFVSEVVLIIIIIFV